MQSIKNLFQTLFMLSNLVRVQWPGSNPKTCTFARRIILDETKNHLQLDAIQGEVFDTI